MERVRGVTEGRSDVGAPIRIVVERDDDVVLRGVAGDEDPALIEEVDPQNRVGPHGERSAAEPERDAGTFAIAGRQAAGIDAERRAPDSIRREGA